MESDLKELDALLEYTIHHNREHAEELKALAEKAKKLGKSAAYDELTSGIEEMKEANKHLGKALNAIRKEKEIKSE